MFFLAHELHRPLSDIADMSYHEFIVWIAYFEERETLTSK